MRTLKTKEHGFSLPELVVVLLVASIILVLALPQIQSTRRLFRLAGAQRQIAASINSARQEAMSQRKPVTVRYEDAGKRLIIFGGDLGPLGDARNIVSALAGSGIEPDDFKYGRPTGVPTAALADTTNLTNLSGGVVDVTFQPDGSVINASNNPQNFALFFYHDKYRLQTAFAVSVLGAGGRVKLWRYSQGANQYVE